MYTIASITSSSFEDLNFLILPKIDGIGNIKKTMIFINSDEKSRILAIYLQTFLPHKLKDRDKDIIKSFLLIVEAKIKTDWLKKFLTSNTEIIICIDVTKMEVDILDIRHII